MALVAPINLPYNVRTLWFDPKGLDIHPGDDVVVQTVRGTELGVAASDVIEVDEESIKKLKSPLKPVLRLATSEDLAKAAEMERLNREAMPIFKDLARQTSEDMHPVSVEYLGIRPYSTSRLRNASISESSSANSRRNSMCASTCIRSVFAMKHA